MKKNTFVHARTLGATVATATMLFAINAQAALPAWASTAKADLEENVEDFALLVGPIVVAVAVGILGIKLFKRFTNKI